MTASRTFTKEDLFFKLNKHDLFFSLWPWFFKLFFISLLCPQSIVKLLAVSYCNMSILVFNQVLQVGMTIFLRTYFLARSKWCLSQKTLQNAFMKGLQFWTWPLDYYSTTSKHSNENFARYECKCISIPTAASEASSPGGGARDTLGKPLHFCSTTKLLLRVASYRDFLACSILNKFFFFK